MLRVLKIKQCMRALNIRFIVSFQFYFLYNLETESMWTSVAILKLSCMRT